MTSCAAGEFDGFPRIQEARDVHPRVLARWRTIFAKQRRSSVAITAFCRSRKPRKPNFHRWRNVRGQLDPSEPKAAFVPIRKAHSPKTSPPSARSAAPSTCRRPTSPSS
ncbi:IS66 family insertion sequence element accessory protein TnpA [Limnoglobus roseus]|uniref:IS66 family insertion sequence element accessory protein TnpA n=1 Tax=Limnoglobus roseus TaxID=2598579 RepID=UPI0036F3846D